jgi:hypothetical protein
LPGPAAQAVSRRDRGGNASATAGFVRKIDRAAGAHIVLRRRGQAAYWTEKNTTAESVQAADLFFGDDPLDLFGLALDTVAATSVGLDGQATDDRINAALLATRAALWPLHLMMHVIVYCVQMSHLFTLHRSATF